MLKNFTILIFVLVASISCKKSTNNGCSDVDLNCAGINCLIFNEHFDFRIVDKNTGEDLVFGPSPRYDVSDVTLFADEAHNTPLPMTTDAGNKLFSTLKAKTQMFLVVDGKNYRLTAKLLGETCCSSRVRQLSIDGQEICSCCSNAIELPVD
jgi:hypothetical protein